MLDWHHQHEMVTEFSTVLREMKNAWVEMCERMADQHGQYLQDRIDILKETQDAKDPRTG